MAPNQEQRPFRHIIRDRMLIEMLRGAKQAGGGEWKVLITDAFTLRVMSASCKMPDVTEEGISLVEDINKRRQPLPGMEALYFIQPTASSIGLFMKDMQGKSPLYKKAHVYFSRPVSKDNLQPIKADPLLRSRIAALREMNLEVLTVDIQGYVTEHDSALVELFKEDISTREYELLIDDIATRLSTVFASMKEFPAVRYRAAKATGAAVSMQRMRELVSTKLAAAVWDRLSKYKASIQDFPSSDTCDLLILDRSVDAVAPIIHDWSYGGMCFDLLPVDGQKYEYEVTGQSGKPEKRTVLLDEHDPVWLEVRDLFLAEAYEKVKEVFDQISAKTSTSDLSGKELHKLVQSLSKYREQKDKVELHIKISSSLSERLNADGLFDVGKLEQGFVFGDSGASYKELAALINKYPDMSTENKMRLLMVYAAMHPEKLDPQKQNFWMKLAKLDQEDMRTVINLEFLGVGINKDASSGFSLSFGSRKEKGRVRKERRTSEEAYELSRFYPFVQDILEDLDEGKLSLQDYPYVQEPDSAPSGSARPRDPVSSLGSAFSALKPSSDSGAAGKAGGGGSARPEKPAGSARAAMSARKKATGGAAAAAPAATSGSSLASWALKGVGMEEKSSSSERPSVSAASSGQKGRRLFVFIVGGMSRSEIRVAHMLSQQLNREVIIGSTSLDTPNKFIQKMKLLKS
ncbi:unnamed protein product [Closterium sp. Naga37s-1]|nr:unnamed protein product [Closterium sp. Naga37s-1]